MNKNNLFILINKSICPSVFNAYFICSWSSPDFADTLKKAHNEPEVCHGKTTEKIFQRI
ncbi:MAG: hypothetical protein NPIRA01_25670 [Nitrospirales bacterium]|nr:MAG: hypothetical protein NPIRA01_25670 [Nitrospirales bacterium]